MKGKKKVIIVLMILFVMLSSVFSTVVQAATQYTLDVVKLRQSGYAYQYEDKDIYKIITVGNPFANTFYCLRPTQGFGNSSGTGAVTYTVDFDLKKPSTITAPYNQYIPSASSQEYNAMLWLLDNFYLPTHSNVTERQQMRDALLQAAGINETGLEAARKITDDDIEVAQQMAIWYITTVYNPNPDYNFKYSDINGLYISKYNNIVLDYDSLADRELQEAGGTVLQRKRYVNLNKLYQYLITTAVQQGPSYGTGDTRGVTAPVSFVEQEPKIESYNDIEMVGPFKITQTGTAPYTLEAKVTTGSTELTGTQYKVYTKTGNTYTEVPITTTLSDTIKSLAGQDFYIGVSQDLALTRVQLEMKASFAETSLRYWSVEESQAASEQPVVHIEKIVKEIPFNKGKDIPTRPFDLALRKFITGVNERQVTNRVPTPALDGNNNIIYNFSVNKENQPVSVQNGDVVIYTIRVYNEGQRAGYASKIKDNIPSGLEYLPNHQINKDYEWVQDGANSIYTEYWAKVNDAERLADPLEQRTGLLESFTTINDIDYVDVKVAMKVIAPNEYPDKIRNIAEIKEDTGRNGSPIPDIDSTPDNDIWGEDDIDDEYIKLQIFDLALRKFIAGVNSTAVTDREPTPQLDGSGNVSYVFPQNKQQNPVLVSTGDSVIYTLRIYNEGKIAGYPTTIKDNIPEGLEFDPTHPTNIKYGWVKDGTDSVYTNYWSKANDTTRLSDEGKTGLLQPLNQATSEIYYRDVQIAFTVVASDKTQGSIRNIAEIKNHTEENGNPIDDIDSEPDNDIWGEDDIDDEYIKLQFFDLALRKFITGVNDTDITDREPEPDFPANSDVVYNFPKEKVLNPVMVKTGDTVIYTIRVYNEGDIPGYASKIKDDIPEGLEYLPDHPINIKYGWKANGEDSVYTEYWSKANDDDRLDDPEHQRTGLLAPLSGTNIDYVDVKVAMKVIAPDEYPDKITNIAEIKEDTDKDGNPIKDYDSDPNNNNPDEDDIDVEHIKLQYFDLALRKFITGVNETSVTDRVPTPEVDNDGKITYEFSKDKEKNPVAVVNGDIITYTIRVYNEGSLSGYAMEIRDDVPEGLEFLPDHTINKQYKWEERDGQIYTDYLNDTLLQGFNSSTMTSPDYADVKVAFKIVEPSTSDRIIKNTAEITEDADEDKNPVDDIDSTPDNNDPKEDDIDYEYVYVKYFDLALQKWVTRVIVIEDGKTTVTETGHTGYENPELPIKVDIDKKKLSKTEVKFVYGIRVINEGEIAGYAKEIKDHIPYGLKFLQEDNPQWTKIDDETVVTRALENTLLQPGESAVVEITLTWIKSENNLGLKTNIAEISEDYNDSKTPDIDSRPDNYDPKRPYEDDEDEAPVLLTLKTGADKVVYFALPTLILGILGVGIYLIKSKILNI